MNKIKLPQILPLRYRKKIKREWCEKLQSNCWLWQGEINYKGYGRCWLHGVRMRTIEKFLDVAGKNRRFLNKWEKNFFKSMKEWHEIKPLYDFSDNENRKMQEIIEKIEAANGDRS